MNALHVVDGALGDQERALPYVLCAHLRVLAGPEHAAGVREHAARQHGAGLHVDLAIERGGLSLGGIGAAVGEDQLEIDVPRRARVGIPAAEHGQRALLADRELRVDGIGLRHGGQRRGIAGAHEVTDVRAAESRHAVDGRQHPRVAEIEPGLGQRGARRGDGGLLRLDVGVRFLERGARLRHARLRVLHGRARGGHRGEVRQVALHRVVQLLLADRPALRQRRVARDVELGLALRGLGALDLGFVLDDLRQRLLDLGLARGDLGLGLAQLRFGQGQSGLGLIHSRLERSRIDLEEQVTALDQRALAIVLADQMAADARADLRVDVADQRPYPLGGDRHVLLDHCLDFDHRGRGRRDGGRVATACGETHQPENQDDSAPAHPHRGLPPSRPTSDGIVDRQRCLTNAARRPPHVGRTASRGDLPHSRRCERLPTVESLAALIGSTPA